MIIRMQINVPIIYGVYTLQAFISENRVFLRETPRLKRQKSGDNTCTTLENARLLVGFNHRKSAIRDDA